MDKVEDTQDYQEQLCVKLVENGVERWRTVRISRVPNEITTIEILD